MEWPARSPDLNPIEHCWDMLQRVIAKRPHQLHSLRELQDALQQEWNALGTGGVPEAHPQHETALPDCD